MFFYNLELSETFHSHRITCKATLDIISQFSISGLRVTERKH